jgi:catechol 2,3-dioxygenase-like lactoylglutathione lyase family enzyme
MNRPVNTISRTAPAFRRPAKPLASLALALALAGCAASTAPDMAAGTVRTPEGAVMQISSDLAYKPGELTQAQLTSSTRDLFVQNSMNVFRRFPRENTDAVVQFYTGALALRSLNPIQLTSAQQMLLAGVGSGQVKLSAGQQGNRKYNLSGGHRGGTGIRFLSLTYPDAQLVADRFRAAGYPAPSFADQGDGTQAALVTDPAGFPIQLVIRPGAQDGSNDGVSVGIAASDLAKSRAFYRDFVGLDELPAVEDRVLGVTKHPYRHGETTLYLYQAGNPQVVDNGSAGIQYVVRDAPMAAAKGQARNIAVETPLNKLAGFDLVTVWLNDPDGVTNYFAQVNSSVQTPPQPTQAN